MKLSPHFTLAELTVSQTAARSGLKNSPNVAQTQALTQLCLGILEPLRARVNRQITVSSGFRSPTINRRIGGSASSQHCKGEAADFTIPGMTVAEVVALIVAMRLPYDQIIDEFGKWVHVSHKASGIQRRQILKARIEGGKTVYLPWSKP